MNSPTHPLPISPRHDHGLEGSAPCSTLHHRARSSCIMGQGHVSIHALQGLSNNDDQNANYPITPLWNLTQNDWFLHGPCRQYPPPDGEYLKLSFRPVNGSFTVDIADTRAVTTLSYNGLKATDWPDGKNHSEPEHTREGAI